MNFSHTFHILPLLIHKPHTRTREFWTTSKIYTTFITQSIPTCQAKNKRSKAAVRHPHSLLSPSPSITTLTSTSPSPARLNLPPSYKKTNTSKPGILSGVGETVGSAVGGVTDTVGNTVSGVGKGVGDTLGGVTSGLGNTVKAGGDKVKGTTDSATGAGAGSESKQTAENPLGL